MDSEKYNWSNRNYSYKRKRSTAKTFLFLFFILVVAVILLSAFYDGFSITGKSIDSPNQNNSISIKTSLSIPDIVLKDEYSEIAFNLPKGSFVNLDNKKISLEQIENRIVILNFKGIMEINENTITKLEGKISEIKINGIPINMEDGKKIKFSIDPEIRYNFFEIKEGVYLRDVSFLTSGDVFIGRDSITLNSEKINFKNYLGSLKIINRKLVLDGFSESVKIEGESRKIILTNK